MKGCRVPKQVDHEERRSEISRAVWQVVRDNGLEGLTLRAVAAAAECTTGMVTHYFRDKKALVAHARQVMHRRMARRIDSMPLPGTARDRLYAVAEQALPLDEERWLEAVVWSQFQLSTRTDPELLHEHAVSHASWVRRLGELVDSALATAPDPTVAGGRVRALVACLDGLALNAVTNPDAYPPELQRKVLDAQLDLILEGSPEPVNTPEPTIRLVPADDPRILGLVRALDTDLAARYPDEPCTGGAHLNDGIRFLLATADDRPVGCCALQPFPAPDGAAELKRMYVSPEARGGGIARRLLAEAELIATALGHGEMRLETAVHQPEAIALYTRAGYGLIPNYPPYEDKQLSRCYAKALPLPEARPERTW